MVLCENSYIGGNIMINIHNKPILKTIGPKSAVLITSLYDEKKTIFTTRDAARITGLSGNTLNVFLSRLVLKGVTTRLKAGLFNIVPFEYGSTSVFVSDPFLIAEKIVCQKGISEKDYFISHGSALEFHQMVTQPQLSFFCSVTKKLPKENIYGIEFNFYECKKAQFFGIERVWIKDKQIQISNIERTILDGLKNPKYCGGLIEVAKGFWIKKNKIDVKKLINYALILDVGTVYRRLGYLLDIFNLGESEDRNLLAMKLTKTYALLDPTLFKEGKFLSKWKLRLNISNDEIMNAVRN